MSDDVSLFDEPWGYCPHCVREVALNRRKGKGARILPHRRNCFAPGECKGTGEAPGEHPGPEAPDEGDYRVDKDKR